MTDGRAMSSRVCHCGRPVEPRDPDPWQGRMDDYCEDCAWNRCDCYPHECPASRSGPVPIEFIGADAEGHVVDTRTGGRLVARGAVSWPLGGEPQGQGWYHPTALVPPGYGGER